jgi:cellulose synthase/poly-beta-1,6-N-acetylglucosamine synthase-like glycosyltransferase
MTDLVSIVVIGRNEGERLRACLQSIAAIDHPNFDFETIYVDSGSTDPSLTLADQLGARTVALQPERPSAALGRNAGWRAAKGNIVLFLDGDTILHPHFIRDSLPDFADETIAVIWGHRRELYPQKSIYIRTLDLDWIYAPGLTPYCGGDALMRKTVLVETEGFDETLIAGEEPELCRRIRALGFSILHVDRPMTGHDLAITHFSQYWKRLVRAGHAYAEVAQRFQHTPNTFWSDEVRRNRNRALTLLTLPLIALAAAILLRSSLPILAVLLFYTAISLRSAWKASWKTHDRLALTLYGIHSHLQQIPIYQGQLHYQWNRRQGRRAKLLEYKQR